MGAGEEGTHERVKTHLVELIDPKIREHHGRIVKTTGDGVLAEFASVVDACAVQTKSRPP
jgi:adenylate cyclase